MKNLKPTIKAISYSVTYDEKGVRKLLKRNGVDASMIRGKRALTNLFIDSLAVSKGLALDFQKYVSSQLNSFKNIDGTVQPYSFGDASEVWSTNPYFNTGTSIEDLAKSDLSDGVDSPDAEPPSKTKKGFLDWFNEITDTGLKAMELQVRLQESKDNVNAVKEIADAENTKLSLSPNNKLGGTSNTAIYVALAVVGVTVLGGIIYYATKK